ncbi:MAG: universal stress protein [Pseudomonadota bacterium]
MTYKTVFTVVMNPGSIADTLDPAIEFCAAMGAHLDVLGLAIDRTQVSYPVAGMGMALQDVSLAQAMALRDEMDEKLRARLARSDIAWSCESLAAPQVSVTALVAERARMADLAILPKPGAEGPMPLEACLFEGRSPVVVLADGHPVPVKPKHVLIAWNHSPEALAAVRAARPFLVNAEKVEILVIDPGRHGITRIDPGEDLARYLARHGANVTVKIAARTLPKISDVILREAKDCGTDAVVLGAYSHSRFREAILGGTTRTLLETATVPVFMAH